MNAKQFAWVYLISNGMANQKPSYYGGFDVMSPDARGGVKEGYGWSWNKSYLKAIKEVGVDWERTAAPESMEHSEFTDTFHDPATKEYLSGDLFLKDGSCQYWCSDQLEVTNVFDMMAKAASGLEDFKTIFGDRS